MEPGTQENGGSIKLTEMALFTTQMEIFTMATGKMTKRTDMEFTHTSMVQSIRATGAVTCSTDMVKSSGLIILTTKVNTETA